MAEYSGYSPKELNNLVSRKIMRYTELLRKFGRKTMNEQEQEEYAVLKSELLELHAVLQLEKEKAIEASPVIESGGLV